MEEKNRKREEVLLEEVERVHLEPDVLNSLHRRMIEDLRMEVATLKDAITEVPVLKRGPHLERLTKVTKELIVLERLVYGIKEGSQVGENQPGVIMVESKDTSDSWGKRAKAEVERSRGEDPHRGS